MTGAKSLLAKLDALKTAIETEVPKAIEDEVQDRGEGAKIGFATAQYDGINDVTVSVDNPEQNVWQINAKGTKVLFIEYGSGIKWKHDSQFGDYASYPPTSWSVNHGRYLTDPKKLEKYHGWWRLPGADNKRSAIFTNGNPSANVMYDTKKALQGNLRIKANKPIRGALK